MLNVQSGIQPSEALRQIAMKILNIGFRIQDCSSSELNQIQQAIPSSNFDDTQKNIILQRVEKQIKRKKDYQQNQEDLKMLKKHYKILTKNSSHMNNHLKQSTPCWLQIFRFITLVIMLAGVVIIGGVVLLEPQNKQLAIGVGITMIITGTVQIISEIIIRCKQTKYRSLPQEEQQIGEQ